MFVCSTISYLEVSSRDYLVASDERSHQSALWYHIWRQVAETVSSLAMNKFICSAISYSEMIHISAATSLCKLSLLDDICQNSGWANFFWAQFGLSFWSKMFCTRVRMRKPKRITTPFQVTALVISWPQGNKRVWITGIELVHVIQLLRGLKDHEQVSYRSKNDKY